MLTSSEIRQQFLEFFEKKGHKIVPSAPVIPHGDPTLLFTNAGMNQFKDVFLGIGDRDYSRATDTQKCIRVSGKHNDLEEVGVDTFHHTFFEMLGNWSFGDYYKKEAIDWAWELLTKVWKLPEDRLYATVFREDEEALEIWKNYLPEERIQKWDEKDNFWEMGDTGPCGPCSEIHFDNTSDKTGGNLVNKDHPQVIEVWNLVFIQYNRKEDGSLENLKNTHVDTGMGLERITRVLQGKDSNYDTDLFMPLINKLSELSNIKYTHELESKNDISMRVIADHIRMLSFSIADGALPGNEGRSYVLRRVLRRAARFSRDLGFREPVLYKLVDTVVDIMGGYFKEITEQKEVIKKVIKAEEESFLQTLDQGLNKLDELAEKSGKVISGDDAFLLYDSYGFPLDLTELIAAEKGMKVDIEGFEENMKKQKERSRGSRKNVKQETEESEFEFVSEFTGYEEMERESKVLHNEDDLIILDKTPFYVESGGQVSDTGTITIDNEKYTVVDTRKSGNSILHYTKENIEKDFNGKIAKAVVDKDRRRNIMRNHSATHLLHEALKRVLGSHIQQQGSLVAPEYLRFDFNHFEKVTKDELKEIESIVNEKILEAHNVETKLMKLEEAQKSDDIKMYFGDKYGETVRAVSMDKDFSTELCGGTHVSNTSEIGFLKIISESSVASGVRRIEAITGKAIPEYMEKLHSEIEKHKQNEAALEDQIKKLEKEINEVKTEQLSEGMSDVVSDAVQVNGINVVTKEVNAENMDQLRELGDELRKELNENGIGLLAMKVEDKVQLVCVVTDDIRDKYPAGKLIGQAAKVVGGGGGGKPHMATAGGKDQSKLDELLDSEFVSIISKFNN